MSFNKTAYQRDHMREQRALRAKAKVHGLQDLPIKQLREMDAKGELEPPLFDNPLTAIAKQVNGNGTYHNAPVAKPLTEEETFKLVYSEYREKYGVDIEDMTQQERELYFKSYLPTHIAREHSQFLLSRLRYYTGNRYQRDVHKNILSRAIAESKQYTRIVPYSHDELTDLEVQNNDRLQSYDSPTQEKIVQAYHKLLTERSNLYKSGLPLTHAERVHTMRDTLSQFRFNRTVH